MRVWAGVAHQLRWCLFNENSLSKGDFSAFGRKKHQKPHFWQKVGDHSGVEWRLSVFSGAEKTEKVPGSGMPDPGILFRGFAAKKVYGLNFLAVWGRNLKFLTFRGGQKPRFLGLCQSAFLKKGRLARVFILRYLFRPSSSLGPVIKGTIEGWYGSVLGRRLEGGASDAGGRAYARQRVV